MGQAFGSSAEPRATTEAFERLRQNVRMDLQTHTSAVQAMHSGVGAHVSAIEILASQLREPSRAEKTDQQGPYHTTTRYLESIKTTLVSQSEALSGTLRHLAGRIEEIACDDVQRTLSSSTTKMYELEAESKRLQSEVLRLDKKSSESESLLNRSNTELNSREKKIRELEREVSTMKRKNDDLQSEVLRLNNRSSELESKFNRSNTELNGRDKKIRELEREFSTVKSRNDDLRRNYEWEKNENERKTYRIRSLEQTNRDLEDRLYRLEEAKRIQKVTVPVQIYCDRKDDLMLRVMSELTSMLTTQMTIDNINLACIRCERREDIQRDKLLLVLCVNASRIGTDASNAISGIPQPDRTALLVLHHKNIHALPNQPSDRMLTTWEFKALAGIFDMAFLADKGIYSCDMNNIAISGILNFVKSSVAKPN